jgi:hypothetical protein
MKKTGCVPYANARLALVTQTLLVAVEFHPLLAFVPVDFRFAALFDTAHF